MIVNNLFVLRHPVNTLWRNMTLNITFIKNKILYAGTAAAAIGLSEVYVFPFLNHFDRFYCAFRSVYRSRGAKTVLWHMTRFGFLWFCIDGFVKLLNSSASLSGWRRFIDCKASTGTLAKQNDDFEAVSLFLEDCSSAAGCGFCNNFPNPNGLTEMSTFKPMLHLPRAS